MTKSEMTAAMFEEIKETMALMDEKLGDIAFNQQQTSAVIQTDVEQRKGKTIKIEQVINYLLDSINKSLHESVDELSNENRRIVSRMDMLVDNTKSLINEFKRSVKKRRNLFIRIIVFQVIAAVSIIFNVHLFNENHGLKDSDLQLKYLKVTNNVDANLAARLDTIFNVYRDEEAIALIRQAVRNNN